MSGRFDCYLIGEVVDGPFNPSFETLGLGWATALPEQPPPPDHLKNIWSEWTWSRWSPLSCCRMSLEHIVGTQNIPAALSTLCFWFWNLTSNVLCGWQEATKLLEGSFGSERLRVCLLERKEIFSMTSDVSWQTPRRTGLQLSILWSGDIKHLQK